MQTKTSIVELKAKAYDILAQIEYLQRLLAETNAQIQEASKAPAEKAVEELEAV